MAWKRFAYIYIYIYAIRKRIRDYCHQREGLGLLLVLLISLGIHVGILLVKPLPRIEEWTDSLTYIQSPCNYFRGEFDSFRTPIYPWLIRGVEWIVSDPQALPAPMAGIQIGCFLLSIPVFYAASRRILQNRWILWGVTLGYACSLQLIYWNFIIHTESLSIVLLVLFYYGMVRFLETPNRRWAVTVSLGTLILCLLRPAFLYIPILLLLFWIFRWVLIPSERRISGSGLLATLLTWSLLGIYAEVNRKHSGLWTLSTVSLVNQFDDVVNAGISNRGTDLTMAARIADLRKEEKAKEHSHSHIFLQLQCQYRYTLPEIQEYVRECCSHGREEYLRYKGEIVINHFRSPFLGLLYGVGCVEWIFCLYLWFCRGKLPWLRLGSWGLVYGGLAVAILGGNTTPDNLWQTQRLISPILPVFYLLIAWEVDTLGRFWQQRKPSL